MKCFSLWAGMKRDGNSGNGSLLRACFTDISQAETALRNTSLAGSMKSSRAFAESLAESVIIQRKVHVSRSNFTSVRQRSAS